MRRLLDDGVDLEREMFKEIRALFAIDKNDGFIEEEVSLACDAHGGLPEVLRQYYFQLGRRKIEFR